RADDGDPFIVDAALSKSRFGRRPLGCALAGAATAAVEFGEGGGDALLIAEPRRQRGGAPVGMALKVVVGLIEDVDDGQGLGVPEPLVSGRVTTAEGVLAVAGIAGAAVTGRASGAL